MEIFSHTLLDELPSPLGMAIGRQQMPSPQIFNTTDLICDANRRAGLGQSEGGSRAVFAIEVKLEPFLAYRLDLAFFQDVLRWDLRQLSLALLSDCRIPSQPVLLV